MVIILLDDTGFAHLSSFGSVIPTPNFDRLADRGLRYTNFHTTALCSPTRACLLTGRNHHSVGMRALANFDTGYPNMRGRIAPSAATMGEVLQAEGFSSFAVGKWHLCPMREASAAGPFTDWPLQRGFDRYYGFMQGETDQFHPELYEDNRVIHPPAQPEDGYHLSEDLVRQAIDMVRAKQSLVPERPFFLYLAFGATHAPHQAPDEYLEKWRGRFDEGWDVWRQRVFERQLEMGVIPAGTELAPRNPGVRPWDQLDADEQRLACRFQEAFAAMLDHTDAQIGELLDAFDELGITDNTLIMALSDNGASQEGNEHGVMDSFLYFNGLSQEVADGLERLDDIGTRLSNTNYPWGWAQVGNSPGKRYKQNTHGGGVRDPLIVSWPNGLPRSVQGQTRQQFHHVSDIAPTVYEALGIDPPDSVKGVAQQAIEGTSFAYTFSSEADDPATVLTRKPSQYFEMHGHRAIWSAGWKAVSYHADGNQLQDDVWELYHVDRDFSECHDLAATEPGRLQRLIDLFWVEAGRYGVLPIQPSSPQLFAGHRTAGTPRDRERFVYYPPMPRVPPDAAPALGSRCWQLTAQIERSAADVGALLAFGTANNGLVLYVDADGHLVYDHNAFTNHTVVRSAQPLPVGELVVGLHQDRVKRGPGRARLLIGDQLVAQAPIPSVPLMISAIGLDVGCNPSGISEDYAAPYRFTGTIGRVEIDTRPALDPEEEAALELLAAERMQ